VSVFLNWPTKIGAFPGRILQWRVLSLIVAKIVTNSDNLHRQKIPLRANFFFVPFVPVRLARDPLYREPWKTRTARAT
jgi:hypothetical protein